MAKNFQNAIQDLRDFLTLYSNGDYYVVGHSLQSKNAVAIDQKGKRMVQVYLSGFQIPSNERSGLNTETELMCTATVRLTVVEKSQLDLSVFSDPSATDQDRANAFAAGYDAEKVADDAMDDLAGRLFDLIMGGEGEWFGNETNEYQIADRWGDDFTKESLPREGSYIVMNGYFNVRFRVPEIPLGATPVVGNIISGVVDIQNNDGDPLEIETTGA